MKRLCIVILLITGFILPLSAAHIRGGELYYQYLGPGLGTNTSKYRVTLKLYIDCGQNNEGQLDENAVLTIFTRPSNNYFEDVVNAPMVSEEFIRYDPASNPCISNPPRDVCYRLRYYEAVIELPDTPSGYTISFQRCCRIEGIKNINPPSNDFGATYQCLIPGTGSLASAPKNSSPRFTAGDAVAVCRSSNLSFDFSATDSDGDSLVYELCNAFAGGGPNNGQNCANCPTPIPSAPPPFGSLSYKNTFSGASPMGPDVTINSKTGMMTGTAPSSIGQYVVTVCVTEYRNNVAINTHRKDIHIKVSDCIPLKANLKPDYAYCDDFNVVFRNEQVNPTGSVYTWDFGDGTEAQTSTVADGTIQHKYQEPNNYKVKLKVVLAGQCLDSTSTIAKVWPGSFPKFSFNGACIFTPFRFQDESRYTYGSVNFRRWEFGDETTSDDTVRQSQNPTWKYNSLGTKTVQLIVGSDKGCIDTLSQAVEVKDKPDLTIPFKDTLMCNLDSLQLMAIGDGVFTWSPNDQMVNRTSGTPVVNPQRTTTYTVTMTENRCVATEDILVRVVDHVTLDAGADTTICTTDTVALNPVSDGLRYTWTSEPQTRIFETTDKYPKTVPLASTKYMVESRIGSCLAIDSVSVKTVPYPIAAAGADTTICFEDTATLMGSMNGSSFRWEPLNAMSGSDRLDPKVYPLRSRTYRLLVYDTLGCPKPGIDEVFVNVKDEIIAFAGNDTAVVKQQPLLLHGSGAPLFEWSPESGLNLTSTNSPIAVLDANASYIMRTFTEEGCFGLDTINVKVFNTLPDIFVPNAFVPNSLNSQLEPKPVGISSLEYFRVFNRWGQMVYQTSEIGRGWNGMINGMIQPTGTYVWIIKATDYTGKKVQRKGTATLVR